MPQTLGAFVCMAWEFEMKEPPFTFQIWLRNQPATTVQVCDLAELVTLLTTMHRDGMLIEAVVNIAVSGVDRRCSPLPSE